MVSVQSATNGQIRNPSSGPAVGTARHICRHLIRDGATCDTAIAGTTRVPSAARRDGECNQPFEGLVRTTVAFSHAGRRRANRRHITIAPDSPLHREGSR